MKKNLMKGGIVALITALALTALTLTGCPNEPADPTLSSIAVTTQPAKTEYDIGETLDTAGMVVTAKYSDGSTKTVTGFTTNGFDSQTVGTKTVTVTFEGKTASFQVTVTGTPQADDFTITGLRHGYKAEITEYKVSITPKEGKSDGTITVHYYDGEDAATSTKLAAPPSQLGSYAVTFDVAADGYWKAAEGLSAGTMEITTLQPPTADMFDITFPTGDDLVYNGESKSVAVTWKDSESDGAVTVKYNGNTTAPINAGTYTITFDVEESDVYTAATNLTAGSLTIAKATPVLAHYDIANERLLQVANNGANPIADALTVTVKTTGIRSNGAVTVYYAGTNGTTYARSTAKPGITGTFAVTFEVAAAADGNWNAATGAAEINPAKTLTLNIFTTIASLGTTLSSASANTVATPYPVELNVSNLGTGGFPSTTGSEAGNMLRQNLTKFVSLDLSGSTALASIPNNAFYSLTGSCTNLVSVIIGNNVTSIGTSAFNGCTSLKSVTLPTNASFTTIANNTFQDCTGLTDITIPASVTSIGMGVFGNCTSLRVTIPASVTNIGNAAFGQGSDINKLVAALTWYYNPAITTTMIANAMLKNLMDTVIIPDTVTAIGANAFEGFGKLTSITIPDSVISIGDYAFFQCTTLASVTFTPTSKVATIGKYAFGFDSLTSITIPASVTSLDDYAFYDCQKLTSVTFEGVIATLANYTLPNGLGFVYPAQGAGTYTRPDLSSSTWTKQP